MKLRTLTLIVGILLIAGFTALNLDEFLRPTVLNLGFSQTEAPLVLGVVVVVLSFFLVALVFLQTSHLLELRRANKEATDQRQLADKAEQSRFTELRQFLQTQHQETLQREQAQTTQTLERMAQLEAKLLTTLEQTANGLAASVAEVEDRLERQIEKLELTIHNSKAQSN
jgi:type III secretory pathway component EscR